MNNQHKYYALLNDRNEKEVYDIGNSSGEYDQSDHYNSVRKSTTKKRFASMYWRWIALPCFCMFSFGSYYSYYTQFTLYDVIKVKITNLNQDEVSFKHHMIYVSYSICGFLFSLLAGLSIVKLGLKVSIITFASIVVFSQSLFTAAGFLADDGKLGSNQQLSYVFAIIGNCIFGIGREGIVVCLFTIICRWFEVQEISTAFGINLAIQRFSTIINAVVPTVFKEIPLGIDFLICLVCTLISLIFAFISNHFELYSQKVDTKNKIISDETKQVFHWSYIFDLGSSFWLISLNSALFYASFNCFNYISEDYVFVRYGESNLNLTNNVHLIAIFIAPALGYLIDKIGNKVTFICVSQILMIISHILFLLIPSCEEDCYWRGIPPILLMGIAYCMLYTSVWPSIPLIVRPEMIGYAYGASASIMNIGVTIGPIITSLIISDGKDPDKYQCLNILLLGFAFIGFLSTYWLWKTDRRRYKGILQSPCIMVIREAFSPNKKRPKYQQRLKNN